MAIKTLKTTKFSWINISRVKEEDLNFLEKNYNFHHLNLTDCLGFQRPKIDTYRNYLFLIFRFPYYSEQSKQIKSKQLNIFIGKDFLISVIEGENKLIKNFYYH